MFLSRDGSTPSFRNFALLTKHEKTANNRNELNKVEFSEISYAGGYGAYYPLERDAMLLTYL
jgi:hypothetical protein